MIRLIQKIMRFFFQKKRSSEKRLHNYQLLRARITKSHFNKQNGFVINEPGLTIEDLSCFKAPMYRFSFSARSELCIFWDSDKMAEEIGNPTGENATEDDRGQNSSRKVLSGSEA